MNLSICTDGESKLMCLAIDKAIGADIGPSILKTRFGLWIYNEYHSHEFFVSNKKIQENDLYICLLYISDSTVRQSVLYLPSCHMSESKSVINQKY